MSVCDNMVFYNRICYEKWIIIKYNGVDDDLYALWKYIARIYQTQLWTWFLFRLFIGHEKQYCEIGLVWIIWEGGFLNRNDLQYLRKQYFVRQSMYLGINCEIVRSDLVVIAEIVGRGGGLEEEWLGGWIGGRIGVGWSVVVELFENGLRYSWLKYIWWLWVS